MRRIPFLTSLFALTLFATGAASAQELNIPKEMAITPKSVITAAAAGEAGLLKAEIIFTGDPKRLMALWDGPDENVQLNTISQTAPGTDWFSFLILSGCTPNDKGKCSVIVSYKSVALSGEVHTVSNPEYVLKDEPPPGGPTLSSQHRIHFEKTDAPGVYTMVARITDLNFGIALDLNKRIRLTGD
jgi:hypothetical protein